MYALPVPYRSFRAWRWWEPLRPGARYLCLPDDDARAHAWRSLLPAIRGPA